MIEDVGKALAEIWGTQITPKPPLDTSELPPPPLPADNSFSPSVNRSQNDAIGASRAWCRHEGILMAQEVLFRGLLNDAVKRMVDGVGQENTLEKIVMER